MRDRDFFELEDRVRKLTRRIEALEQQRAATEGSEQPRYDGELISVEQAKEIGRWYESVAAEQQRAATEGEPSTGCTVSECERQAFPDTGKCYKHSHPSPASPPTEPRKCPTCGGSGQGWTTGLCVDCGGTGLPPGDK